MRNFPIAAQLMAFYPFYGFSEFDTPVKPGSFYFPAYTSSWPKVYSVKTETWITGGPGSPFIQVTTCLNTFFDDIGGTDIVTTGSHPSSGDFSSSSAASTTTTYNSSGPAGSYSIVLSSLLTASDWLTQTNVCLALLNANTVPDLPPTNYHSFGNQWDRAASTPYFISNYLGFGANSLSVNSSTIYPGPGGTTLSSSMDFSTGAGGPWFGGASVGMPMNALAKNANSVTPFFISGNSVGDTQTNAGAAVGSFYSGGISLGGDGLQKGAVVCSKSKWRTGGIFGPTPPFSDPTLIYGINQKDHRTVSFQNFTFGYSGFTSGGILTPGSFVLNTGVPTTMSNPVGYGTLSFDPADISSLCGEVGFNS